MSSLRLCNCRVPSECRFCDAYLATSADSKNDCPKTLHSSLKRAATLPAVPITVKSNRYGTPTLPYIRSPKCNPIAHCKAACSGTVGIASIRETISCDTLRTRQQMALIVSSSAASPSNGNIASTASPIYLRTSPPAASMGPVACSKNVFNKSR
jgi:hypothetical protein